MKTLMRCSRTVHSNTGQKYSSCQGFWALNTGKNTNYGKHRGMAAASLHACAINTSTSGCRVQHL